MSDGAIKGVPVNTLYQTIKKSTPAEFAKDKPVIAAIGTAGAAVIVGQTMSTSKIAMEIGKKGLIPAVAAGVAITGAAMVHDAIVNNTPVADDKSTPENEHVEHVIEKTIKTTAGTAMLLGGTEVIGHSYDINALKPLTNIFESGMLGKGVSVALIAGGGKIIYDVLKDDKPAAIFSSNDENVNSQAFKNLGKSAVGIVMVSAGSTFISDVSDKLFDADMSLPLVATTSAVVSFAAAKNMKEKGVGIGNSTALTIGLSGVTTVVSSFGKKGDFLDSGKGLGIVGGAGLGLISYSFAKTAKGSFDEGHQNIAALSSIGAVTMGVASIHVLGNATGIEALSNLAPKVFGKNPLLAGAIVATGLTVGSYMIYSNDKKAEEKSELKK